MQQSSPPDLKIILLGNKNDRLRQREVSLEEGRDWANSKGFFFMEVSAKTNQDDCVTVGFNELIRDILKSMEPSKKEEVKELERMRVGSLHQVTLNKQQVAKKPQTGCCK